MDKKQFEMSARTLLKYGVGSDIEEAREKLRVLIEANRITNKYRDVSIVGMVEAINEESNKRRWKSKAEKDYDALRDAVKENKG